MAYFCVLPLLQGFKMDAQNFAKKRSFWGFISKMKITCLPIFLNILTIYLKWHFFQFFSRGIRMHIPILTGVQNGRMILRKKSCFAKKYFFLKFIFWDEDHLYANCKVYILTIYYKCLLFKFLVCGICMYIFMLTGD